MTNLSPAAQAVLDAYVDEDRAGRLAVAAALRAAAVASPEIDLPLFKVIEWEKIEGVCTSYYAAAEWGYRQALAHINTIATELEAQ
jgi:hypothetical protein